MFIDEDSNNSFQDDSLEGIVIDMPEGAESNAEDAESKAEDKESDEQQATEEKKVPERRLKAAVKNLTDQLAEAQQQIAQLTQAQAPDKEKDPEGYDLHKRVVWSAKMARSAYPDFDKVMAHYIALEKDNPDIGAIIAKQDAPAIAAYDFAKRDLDQRDITALKDSPEWEEFLKFREQQAQIKKGKKMTVPDMNKETNAKTSKSYSESDDDDLFKGAL